MKPNKLKILLLLLGWNLTTPYFALKEFVNPPDSIIHLLPKEYDFYAQAVVERKQLRKDTTNLRSINRAKDTIIFRKNNQLLGCQLASSAKDSIAIVYKNQYNKEQSARISTEKRLERSKNFNLILGSIAGILLIIVAFIH